MSTPMTHRPVCASCHQPIENHLQSFQTSTTPLNTSAKTIHPQFYHKECAKTLSSNRPMSRTVIHLSEHADEKDGGLEGLVKQITVLSAAIPERDEE